MIILLVFDSRQAHIIVLVICNCVICTNSIIHFFYIVFFILGQGKAINKYCASAFSLSMYDYYLQTACILKLMEINCIELN